MPVTPTQIVILENAELTASGSSASIELHEAARRWLQVNLAITKVVEQESLDVSIYGSPDGVAWTPKPLAMFSQKFYVGAASLMIDLSKQPEIQHLQARWKLVRWGRADLKPWFQVTLSMTTIDLAG